MIGLTRFRLAAGLLLGGLFAALFAIPGISRGAAWTAPAALYSLSSTSPSAAMDAAGNTVVAWESDAGTHPVIQGAHHLAGTTGFPALPDFGNDLSLGLDNDSPVVVVNRNGNGLVAWVHQISTMGDHNIEIVPIAPDGSVGTLVSVDTAGGSDSGVTAAINSNGDAVVAWLHGGAVSEAVTRKGLGGSFTNTATPDQLDPLAGGSPAAAIDGAGNAIVVMKHASGGISARRHTAAGGWQPLETISPGGGHVYGLPDVAANPAGQMVVPFQDSLSGDTVISYVKGTVAAGWGAGTATALSGVGVTHGPSATVDDAGGAVVGWTTATAVQTSTRAPGADFPPPASVSTIGTTLPDDFALAGSGRGDTIAAWGTFDTAVTKNVVRAVVRPAGSGSFGASQIVSDTGNYANDPRIALDERGDGAVVYPVGATPAGISIAVFDATPPQLGAISGPGSVTRNRSALYSVPQPTDAFSPTTVRWTFGDGSAAATGRSVAHTFTSTGRFTVTATASDGAANSAVQTLKVTVTAPSAKCVVPKLKGRTLAQARTALGRAHCRLGRVHQPKRPRHRRLRKLVVRSSSPSAGRVRPAGTKVGVTLVEVPKRKPRK